MTKDFRKALNTFGKATQNLLQAKSKVLKSQCLVTLADEITSIILKPPERQRKG